MSEQELKPTPCMWDPTDLKYFRDSTNQDMQIEFQSPIGSRSVRSLHSVTEMSGYPTPLQIPSHSYEPKYYLNVSYTLICSDTFNYHI